MKTINFIQCSIALATTLFISSCSDDDDSAQGGSSSQGITTVEAIIPEPLLWNADNTIALYAKKADSEKNLFYTEDSQVSEATFEAVKKAFPTPEEGDYIRAFYPAGKAKEKANAASTPLLAPGTDPTDTQNILTQKGNATQDHLSAFYYMYGVSAFENGAINTIEFQPQMAILTLKITLPAEVIPTTVDISTNGKNLIKSVNCNNYPASAADFKFVTNESTNKVTLNLKDFEALQQLEANVLLFPVDLSGKQLAIAVTDESGEVYNGTLEGIAFEKGQQYTLEVTVAKEEEPEPEPDEDYTKTGEGTETSPWIITSAAQLRAISRDSKEGEVNDEKVFAGKHFKLDADISLDGEDWEPIGEAKKSFAGVFDGNGKTISGMKISRTNASGGIGFFAYTKNAKIMNLTITGSIDIISTGATQTGGLIGQSYSTELSGNIRSEVDITITNDKPGITRTGGLVGEWTNNSKIFNGSCLSYNGNINVTNKDNAHTGGIIGGITTNAEIMNTKCIIEEDSQISTQSRTGNVWLGGFIGNSNPTFLTNKLPNTTESHMLGTLSANANGDAIICYAIGWSNNPATTKGFNESFKDNANYNLEGSTVTSEKGKAYKNGEEVSKTE